MSFDVIALPGADWSVDGTSAPRSSDGIALTSTPGLGDAAWGGCSDAQLRCTLHVFRGGSWFVLSVFNATTGLDALVALAHGVID
jgi:hypothetical protein